MNSIDSSYRLSTSSLHPALQPPIHTAAGQRVWPLGIQPQDFQEQESRHGRRGWNYEFAAFGPGRLVTLRDFSASKLPRILGKYLK